MTDSVDLELVSEQETRNHKAIAVGVALTLASSTLGTLGPIALLFCLATGAAAIFRRAKNEPSEPRDLAGACSGGQFVVSRVGGAHNTRDGGPNRKFRSRSIVTISR
jgi:hypothetical protein